jgi:hypothetical protein
MARRDFRWGSTVAACWSQQQQRSLRPALTPAGIQSVALRIFEMEYFLAPSQMLALQDW